MSEELRSTLAVSGAVLNLTGALCLAIDFWRKREVDAPVMEREEMWIQLCRALEEEPVDKERIRDLRQIAATEGIRSRSQEVGRFSREHFVQNVGLWGIGLLVAGFFLQLLSS